VKNAGSREEFITRKSKVDNRKNEASGKMPQKK